jgi:hypothetical protein
VKEDAGEEAKVKRDSSSSPSSASPIHLLTLVCSAKRTTHILVAGGNIQVCKMCKKYHLDKDDLLMMAGDRGKKCRKTCLYQ